MIEFRILPDKHTHLALSPILRAAQLTLGYALEHDSIGLTATKAFKRDFVHWAVENFDWPGKPAAEVFRHQRFVNEADFPPLEFLHFLLIRLRLGRHYKGTFRVNNNGRMSSAQPADPSLHDLQNLAMAVCAEARCRWHGHAFDAALISGIRHDRMERAARGLEAAS